MKRFCKFSGEWLFLYIPYLNWTQYPKISKERVILWILTNNHFWDFCPCLTASKLVKSNILLTVGILSYILRGDKSESPSMRELPSSKKRNVWGIFLDMKWSSVLSAAIARRGHTPFPFLSHMLLRKVLLEV